MDGSGRKGGGKRRKPSSARWLARQARDPYVARAQKDGYRSRAAYKLVEIDDRFRVLPRDGAVVDLGCAPGGWCQVALRRGCVPVVGIDVAPVEALDGARLIEGDIREGETCRRALEACGTPPLCVLSDMASPATGQRSVDRLRVEALAEAAADFALATLAPDGTLVVKLLGAGPPSELRRRLAGEFGAVAYYKPAASRVDSSETYLVACGRRAASSQD